VPERLGMFQPGSLYSGADRSARASGCGPEDGQAKYYGLPFRRKYDRGPRPFAGRFMTHRFASMFEEKTAATSIVGR